MFSNCINETVITYLQDTSNKSTWLIALTLSSLISLMYHIIMFNGKCWYDAHAVSTFWSILRKNYDILIYDKEQGTSVETQTGNDQLY